MRVAVIGSGYVGLVTGACLAASGHRVACVDVDTERIAAIRAGRIPFYEPSLPELVESGLRSGQLEATSDLSAAALESQVSILAVGTPPAGEQIDLGYVTRAAEQLGEAIRRMDHYHVVAVKSTVVPGTTEEVVRPALERASGRLVGEFGLCMNPEFLREGSAVDDFMHPDRIVIGEWDERSGSVLAELY